MILRNRTKRAGSTTIEFLLVGIPVIFLVISVFEVARAMWVYQTLAHAVHSVARKIAVRGNGCGSPNTCSTTLGTFATDFASTASGMDSSIMKVTFYSQSSSIACNPLNTCYSNSTAWPPVADNAVGNDVRISASIPFATALAMFWPGTTPVTFASLQFAAYSKQRILF